AATNWRGEQRKLFLFRVRDRQLSKTIILGREAKGESLSASSPVFSPDGKWLAVVTQALPKQTRTSGADPSDFAQPRIHLIEVAAGEIRETLVAPPAFPWSAAFSPDGKTLATAGHGRVLLWDMTKPPGSLQTAGTR